jgi:hypothetical protein
MRIRLTSTLPSARPRSPCRSGASTTTHHEAEDDEAHQPKRSDHRASAPARYRGDLRTCGRSPFPPSPFWFWSAPWWCSVIRAPCACTHCWARASLGDSNPARPAPRPIALTGQPSALAPSPERLPASARLPPQSMRSASQFLAWIFASSSRRARASSSAARCSCAHVERRDETYLRLAISVLPERGVLRRLDQDRVTEPEYIPVRERVGHRESRLHLGRDVRSVDPADQALEVRGHALGFGEESVRILGRRFALLMPGRGRDPLADLQQSLLQIRSQLQRLGELQRCRSGLPG